MSEHVLPDVGKFSGIVRADVKELGLLVFGKGIETNGKTMTFPALPDAS
jgi:hypothetical protein